MVYVPDPTLSSVDGPGVVVLFSADDNGDVTTTWTFDGTAWHQTQMAPGTIAAGSLDNVQATTLGQAVILFGGYRDGNQNPLSDDTWGWKGTTWTDYGPDLPVIANASGTTPVLLATLP
jgi:hypothetical protein